jgi:hypothetical protein
MVIRWCMVRFPAAKNPVPSARAATPRAARGRSPAVDPERVSGGLEASPRWWRVSRGDDAGAGGSQGEPPCEATHSNVARPKLAVAPAIGWVVRAGRGPPRKLPTRRLLRQPQGHHRLAPNQALRAALGLGFSKGAFAKPPRRAHRGSPRNASPSARIAPGAREDRRA